MKLVTGSNGTYFKQCKLIMSDSICLWQFCQRHCLWLSFWPYKSAAAQKGACKVILSVKSSFFLEVVTSNKILHNVNISQCE